MNCLGTQVVLHWLCEVSNRIMNTLGKCTEKQILTFEQKYHVQIPDSFKLFLMKTNGIVWDDGICIPVPSVSKSIQVDAIFGVGLEKQWLDMGYWLEQYADELPSGTLIIGSDVLEGFILILNMPENSGVYYWDDKLNLAESTATSNCYYICGSIKEFLKKLFT